MARGVPHSDETRAAVLAAILAGQNVSQVAKDFKLNHATVIAWRDAAGLNSTRVQPETHAEIGELVLRHVRSALRSLEAQAAIADDHDWLKAQSASDLAAFYGIVADKAHRILAALEPEDDPADHPTPIPDMAEDD